MRRRISFWDWMVLWFVLGTLGGTLLINIWKPGASGAGDLNGLLLELASGGSVQDKQSLLVFVAKQRIGHTVLMVLMAVTSWSVPWFCFLAFYGGISGSVILSMITCQKGLMGLPCYLTTLFPQYLFYLMIWFVLAGWASKDYHRVRPGALLGIAVLLLAGIGAEVWINPLIAGIFC